MTKAGIYGLRIAALVSSAIFVPGAFAQEAGPAADDSTATTAEDTGIGAIIVTANRREQKLQDVPIAISAVTAQMAEQQGVTGTASLQTVVPSLVFARQGNVAQPYLRGLGSLAGLPNAEPSVALYIDGVYHPSANANFFEFNNVERIEVLKGPQGTLFGRNATGGVIQIITKDPGSRPEADFKIGYANYDTVTANAYLSAPITDSLGANIAVLYKNQGDGWGTNLFTGEDTVAAKDFGVRGKLVWKGDNTTIRLSGDYSHNRNGGVNGQNPEGALAGGQPFPGEYNTNNNWEQRSDVETGGASLKIDHDFGPLQLMSLSAYRKTEGFWTFDQDLSPTPVVNAVLNQSGRMYSQEVHLLSPSSSKLQWLVGAYYYNYKAGYDPVSLYGFAFNSAPQTAFNPTFPGCAAAATCGFDRTNGTKATSYSAFAQGTYPITDSTNLTLGFRYTWDKVDYYGTTYYYGTDTIARIGSVITGGPADSDPFKRDKPTFRISVDHKLSPDVMVYASFNRGVKTGGIDIGSNNQLSQSTFEPEQLNAYELGIKTDLFDRKVRFNLGGFYYDFKNMQFQRVSQGVTTIFNAPNGAEMYGVEAELNARVTSQLTLNGSIGYLHTKIRDFEGAPHTCRNTDTGVTDPMGSPNNPTAGQLNPATGEPYNPLGYACNGTNGLPDPDNLIVYNAEGNRTPNSPEWTINAGFVYEIPATFGTVTLAGNAYHTSKRYFELDNRLSNPAMWLFNGSVKWTDPSDHLSLSIWGKNLGNEYYYTQMSGQVGVADVASPAAPREYGVTLGYRF